MNADPIVCRQELYHYKTEGDIIARKRDLFISRNLLSQPHCFFIYIILMKWRRKKKQTKKDCKNFVTSTTDATSSLEVTDGIDGDGESFSSDTKDCRLKFTVRAVSLISLRD